MLCWSSETRTRAGPAVSRHTHWLSIYRVQTYKHSLTVLRPVFRFRYTSRVKRAPSGITAVTQESHRFLLQLSRCWLRTAVPEGILEAFVRPVCFYCPNDNVLSSFHCKTSRQRPHIHVYIPSLCGWVNITFLVKTCQRKNKLTHQL